MAESPIGDAATPSTQGPRPNRRGMLRTIGIGVALFIALLLFAGWWFFTESTQQALKSGRLSLVRRQFEAARAKAEQVLRWNPRSVPALLLAAEAEIGAGRSAEALPLLESIPDDGSRPAVEARLLAAKYFLNERQELEPTEQQLRRALQMAPDTAEAQETLAYVLGLQSRSWEVIPWRLRSLMQGGPTTLTLFSLCLADNALENPEKIEELRIASPNDPGVQLAVARVQLELKNYANAEKFAAEVIKHQPERAEAYVQRGRALLELADEGRMIDWSRSVPAVAEEHPGIWFVRGAWALRMNKTPTAARCFWETVRRDPNHQKACYQLGQSLAKLQRKSDAEAFLSRAEQLETYVRQAELGHNLQSPQACLQASRHAEQLGLLWEAWGWARVILDTNPQHPAATEISERLHPRLQDLPLVRTAPGSNPADSVDLSAYPLPDNATFRRHEAPSTPTAIGGGGFKVSTTAIRFEDAAASVGLTFDYYNGGEPKTKGLVKMYEVVGGGAAVLDYDQDGLPDIYLPQGAPWPVNIERRKYLDQLNRNRGDGQFEDVTSLARIVEPGFSNGATVGDVNDDGFPDLFVANIGNNRLFINNGDGTFEDASHTLGKVEQQYSASALIADVNGDLWPDIYVVNYLAGDDLFTRVCGDQTGYVGSCLPQLFGAAPDQLYLNLGDGRFEEISREAGVADSTGKGLGIVAFAAEPSGPLRVFIANDVGPNFLLINTAAAGQRPRFVDEGLIAGVAVNGNGRSESSMGVAAGDYDGNGLLDLFVTNFDEETNTLYAQQSAGSFADRTALALLSRKRERYVGWGTQFLDADLDGWPDLILTNGHVNDVRRHGNPFQMPAEFFHNRGDGTFENMPAAALGPFFSRQLLGRGLARLDWNADGREDVVISHLDAPVALLTNTTASPGHYFALELRGVESNRDAIGTIVRVVARGRTRVQQLTAGDGNQASNERKLVFGLGAADRIERVDIQWPSGRTTTFADLPADTAWLAIEGRAQPIPRRYR